MRVECEGGAAAWLAGILVKPSVQDTDCLCRRSDGPIRVFFQASCSWQSEGLFGQSFSIAPPVQTHRRGSLTGVLLCGLAHQSLKGAPWVGSYSVVHCVGCLMGQPLYCSAASAGVWGERLWWWFYPLHATQQHHLASMATWLSSTGISHHDLLPHIPSIHLFGVNSSPRPGIAPQSLNSSSQPLRLPGDQRSCPGYIWL